MRWSSNWLGLLVRITDMASDMMLERIGSYDVAETRRCARELRAATDRLSSIVHAVTAVHSLGSAES
jgi:hypothetical protein